MVRPLTDGAYTGVVAHPDTGAIGTSNQLDLGAPAPGVPTISTILLSADAWKSASMATSATCDSNGCESVFHQITTVR